MSLLTSFTDDKIIDRGNFIQIDPICFKKLSNGTCNKFYENLLRDDACTNHFVRCPNGYAVFISKTRLGIRIYPCLRCKGIYTKKIKSNQEVFYNPVMPESQLLKLINEDIMSRELKKQYDDSKEYISTLTHDVKNLNSQIKEHCDVIFAKHSSLGPNESIEHEDAEKIIDRLTTIFLSSSMISSRFAMYDFSMSPEEFITYTRFECNIYKKFDKIKRIFKNYLKKHVKIYFEGNSFKAIDACSFFEFIPLLLLENAIKYAQNDDEITVTFQDSSNSLIVTIASFGPYCDPEEIGQIWEKDFRGKYAQQVSQGHGLGLFFVKQIADLHNIKVSACSFNSNVTINGVPHGKFVIELKFKNTYSLQD